MRGCEEGSIHMVWSCAGLQLHGNWNLRCFQGVEETKDKKGGEKKQEETSFNKLGKKGSHSELWWTKLVIIEKTFGFRKGVQTDESISEVSPCTPKATLLSCST